MEKKFVKLINGETIAYLEQGHGEKTLLLIHGNLSSSVYYLPLIKQLPENVHTIAVDLRGFGDSSYLRKFGSLKELADDIALFIKALSLKKVFVTGWSLGGGVAMELAAHYPALVEKLILINSTTHKGYPIFKKDAAFKPLVGQIYASADEMANDPLQVRPVLDAIKVNNTGFMTYIYDLTIYTVSKPALEDNVLYISETMKQRCLPEADYALATLNMGSTPNFYRPGDNTISKIQCPVLHFWGTKDLTVPEYMVLENIEALKAKSTFIKFENCGHSPLVDKPKELGIEILKFVI